MERIQVDYIRSVKNLTWSKKILGYNNSAENTWILFSAF